MNQLVTNKPNSKTIMRQILRKRKPRLTMRAVFLALCALIFVMPAKAQVYMHNGSSYVGTSGVKFYDSGGPSKGPANYWLHWFSRNEFTYTFNPETAGYAIQVDFESFTAYTDNNGTNDPHALQGTFSMRLNDATLSVYEGTEVNAANLITTLTGTIIDPFTIMSSGPITFHFNAVNAHTEEGWGATVKAIPATDYELQKPAISMEVCSDLIVLYPTTLGAQVRYTTNGSNPGTSSTLYEEPFSISYPTTVKAITVSGNNVSEVADKTYNASDATPVPAASQDMITREGNTIIITPPAVPDHINETYGVIYTRAYNGGTPEDPVYLGYGNPNNVGTYIAPDGWNGAMPGKVHIDWSVPNTNFKFCIVAQTCAKQSSVITYNFAKLQVPDPSIEITDNNNTGTATISWEAGYVIRYTTDGTIPSTTSGTEVTNGTSVTVNNLAPGTTVRVIAYKVTDGAVDPNYDPSNMVVEMYLPGGGNSGTYGGIVILNDLEDHNWSYYSDADSPIKSLNPADVKITYYGNSPAGRTTMTTDSENGNTPTSFSATATGVKVNIDEDEDQFIYLKTLEKDETSGNYPYTMIPNPFQVRPTYEGGGSVSQRTFVVTLSNSDSYDNWNHDNGSTVTVSYGGQSATITGSTTAGGSISYEYIATIGTEVTITFNANSNGWANYCRIAVAYNDGTTIFDTYNPNTSGYNPRTFNVAASSGGSSASKYRGFYAWRVKSLSSGLTIKAKNSNTTYGVNATIPAETEIEFVTSSSSENEVEFEALWAQAYVTTSTNTSGLVSAVGYERNFMVLSSNPSSQTQTVTVGSGTSTTNGQRLPIYSYGTDYPYSITQQIYTSSEIGSAGQISAIQFYVSTSRNNSRNLVIYMKHTDDNAFTLGSNNNYWMKPVSASDKVFTGSVNFNSTGWNTITLDTPFDYDGSSNLIVCVVDNTGTYMTNKVTFRTYSTNSNRAWYTVQADSHIQDLDQGTYFSSAFNNPISTSSNQIQFTMRTNAHGNEISNLTVPCTVMACNPDGTNQSSTVTVSGNILCGADLKIENVKMDGSLSSALNGNGHSLIVGRGVTPGTSGLCSGYVYGYLLSSAPTTAINFKLRLESGKFNEVYSLYGTSSISLASATTNVGITFGSDYDRASGTTGNSKFEIAGTYSLTFRITNSTATSKFITNVFSGTYTCATDEFYMGYWTSASMKSIRYNTIYGGDFANGITLGIDQSADANTITGYLRIYGGNFQEQVYATGQYAEATGSRRIVITGGTFGDWIAAGCYGTNPSGGYLNGNVALYFGGKANQTSNAGLFGSGYGTAEVYGTADEDSYYVNASTVVIADQAQVAGSVYGGGNNGFAQNSSDIHILGGTIRGNVFGGANKSKGATINVYVKDGTVAGNVYGGSDTKGVISGLATVEVSGGTVNNVFGGGLGASTDMAAGTAVNIFSGTINNNVYGGGEEGTVSEGGTHVSVSGGTMNDVYGAGKGGTTTALISGQTIVDVTGGTIVNVYGGGENGNVAFGSGSGSSGETCEDFESVTGTAYNTAGSMPSGWFSYTTATGANIVAPHVCSGNQYNYYNSGSQSLNMESGSNANNTAYVVLPLYSNVTALTFYARCESPTYGTLTLGYVDAQSATACNNFTSIATVSLTTTIEQKTYDFAGTYTLPEGKYLAFRWVVTNGTYYACGIDDVCVTTEASSSGSGAASIVTINGGNISENVFGGGAFGTTAGNTIVNVKNGSVHGSVYGGALGEQHQVYVAGQHTVNVLGGHVFANVYGGSRNADDALSFNPGTFANATDDETVCVVNISGGQIDQQVYAAGFFGNCFGSVYAFVGKNAIYNAPNHVETEGSESAGEEYAIAKLSIAGSVWAGGDWGTFVDQFGDATISGNSNVYVDGLNYITNTSDKNTVGYMGIDGSLFGSGTSCDAGKLEHTVMLRNYGQSNSPYNSATRDFGSIQRADYIVLDNVHVDFQGQGRINSLNVTETYSIYEATEAVIVTGGSTLIMDAPVDQVMTFWSTSCGDVYTAVLPTKQANGTYNNGGYTVINPSTLSATPNKIRVTGGNYIKIFHDKQQSSGSGNNITYTPGYGMLNGYAYMMTSDDNEATCAYARPRWCANDDNLFHINDANYDNRNDGGWVSYVSGDNVFDLEGNEGNIQMAYENHTPGSKVGEDYFRIWRTTGQIHEREGVFDVVAYGNDVFGYVDVEIELPAWRGHNYFYAFQTQGTAPALATTTDYGPELMTYNAALYDNDAWIYYDDSTRVQVLEANAEAQAEIKSSPDVNFGLVIMSGTGNNLSSPAIDGTPAPALIINNDADEFLVKQNNGLPINQFTYAQNDVMPTVKFRLTYSDLLSTNKTYEPMWVNLVQCDGNGRVTDIVKIKLIVNTSTIVGRNFETEVYAVMNGNGSTAEEAHAQVVLPRFNLNVPGVDSRFTVESIEWNPAELPTNGGGQGTLVNIAEGGFDKRNFAMEFSISENYDGTTGWNELDPTVYDTRVEFDKQTGDPLALDPADLMGTTGGRSQFSFDFTLNYNGQELLDGVVAPELMGTLVYHMRFTNYGTTSTEYPNGSKDFTITIKVYRRGLGNRFYLDGVNGKNSYPGTKPDRAMLTLSAIFTRSGFLPGDEIYVVNQVTAGDDLEWNGLTQGGQVKIYRYNGGHELYDEEVGIIGNPDNTAYTGALVNVPNGGHMIIRGIDLDGYYNDGGTGAEYSTVTASSPLITVQNGGTLELNQSVLLEQNYNTNDGGAVYVYDGGTLMMNQDATITDNKTDGNGGGVFMSGTMIVSDMVTVWDNINGSGQNNVYLAGIDKMLQIGEDDDSENYKDLDYVQNDPGHTALIGLSKPIDYFVAGIAEVVYSNELDWLDEPHETQTIIVHDGGIYKLETGEDPNILYWIDTWVTWVTSQPANFSLTNIDSEEDLAWVISIVNGENGCEADNLANKKVVIKKDLDMHEHTWVPIGERNNVFKGEFEGNGFVIEGLVSSLYRTDLGMFGITENANIHDVVAVANFNGVANNYATVIGTMKGGTLTNVEAAGNLTGDDEYAQNIGGLVAVAEEGSTIHSCFSVNTIVAQRDETMVGGLVAVNGADLYNSYSNVTITGTTNTSIGGLVGENTGHVENCYAVVGTQTFPAFAFDNTNGTITICYADRPNGYVVVPVDDPSLTGHGTYGTDLDPKAVGYMYYDNEISLEEGQTNDNVVAAIIYDGRKIDRWPGMLSALNYWVDTHTGYTSWFRPTSTDINGDLPILGFEADNSLATSDGKFLRYSSIYDGANGLDNLFTRFDGKSVNMFLYDNAIDVTLGTGSNMLFINEDAVLIQKATGNTYPDINATVGVSFDNSSKNAHDYWGNDLKYDWHLMSTPLADAALGISYGNDTTDFNYWEHPDTDKGQAVSVEHSYMPNMSRADMNADWSNGWDFYTYYEPKYHWINFKRNIKSHHHYDEPHQNIPYEGMEQTTGNLIPGRGYMMAIDQDTYLNNSGKLNSGDVTITLTISGSQVADSVAPTKDWGSNLVGNPYQAYLNLAMVSKAVGQNGAYQPANGFYVYDADYGTYGPYITNASSNPAIPSKYIHPHQAFFVVITGDPNTQRTLTFTPEMATDTLNDESYFRGEEQPRYPVVNLFAENEAGNRDLAVIELNRPELGGVIKVDNLRNANFKISANLGGHGYGLLFTPEGTEKVPVHFQATEDGVYTLTWSMYNGNFTSLRLIDNKTGVNYDMLANDSYTFEASADDYTSRFYITYSVIGVEENVTDGDNSFAYFNGSEWVINGKGHLDVIDVTGRVLFAAQLNNEENRVHLDGVAKGVYLLRVIDNKVVRTQKIIVR